MPRAGLKLFDHEIIKCSAEAKYLGIQFDRNLTWKAHIKDTGNIAIQRSVALYFIFKCRTLDRKLESLLYITLSRSIQQYRTPSLDYADKSTMTKYL
jgi:hypothetical protein